MENLHKCSINVIKENQSPTGAYIASPNFSSYAYSWFRDGAYIAYSMDLIGEHHSARRFHDWAADVIGKKADVIERAVESVLQNGKPSITDYLHTRYTLAGEEDYEDWSNYQLDGIGTWLWSLKAHRDLTKESLPGSVLEVAELAVRYLSFLWQFPCSDSWEEYPDKIHTYTLASIYAGIKAISELMDKDHDQVLNQLQEMLFNNCVKDGFFVKYLGSNEVDANLISLSVPYRVVEVDHPLMKKTIDRLEKDLYRNGGLHRYLGDTYYGGGEWILLTAWLGWYWAERGEKERAREFLSWIESQSDDKGYLPEQVPNNLNKPSYYDIWRDRWGEIANPLLWSHAKYLILRHTLDNM